MEELTLEEQNKLEEIFPDINQYEVSPPYAKLLKLLYITYNYEA